MDVCACVRIPLYLWNYAVDFNRMVLILFVFYSVWGKKIILYDSPIRFLFYFEFLIFEKFFFGILLMIGLKFMDRIGSIRMRIKKPKFKKKKISSYHGSFVITKNVFFFFFLSL